jgi:alkylation response protein AidB-like acyl-CoA dehydrogenase
MNLPHITKPNSPELAELVRHLRELAEGETDESSWPQQRLNACAEAGVFEWFITKEWGGQEWSEADLVRGYLELSMACLTTTFIITQRTGACQRIERSGNQQVKHRLLPDLVRGSSFATVGISHLTTSRRHLRKPVLRAKEQGDLYVLDGYSPWITGADHAQTVVVGATLPDERQILLAVPTDRTGITVPSPEKLVGLSGRRLAAGRTRSRSDEARNRSAHRWSPNVDAGAGTRQMCDRLLAGGI